MVTGSDLRKAFPMCKDPDGWAAALKPALDRFGITTPARQCAFLAQTGHESAQFSQLAESLNFKSVERLMEIYPRRFTDKEMALPFVGNPEGLGNRVYARRMGNGDETSGDGFRYRGRGLIQLTGRSNYQQAARALQLQLVESPDLVASPAVAALTAAWFWDSRGLNALADDETDDDDREDFIEITRRINGGTNGLAERVKMFARLREVLH